MSKAKKPKLYGLRKYWPELTEEQAENEEENEAVPLAAGNPCRPEGERNPDDEEDYPPDPPAT